MKKHRFLLLFVFLIIIPINALEYTRNVSYELIPGIEPPLYRLYAYEQTVYQITQQLENQVQELLDKQPRRIRRQIVLAEDELILLLPNLIDIVIEYENLTATHQIFNIKGKVDFAVFIERLLELSEEKREIITDYRRNLYIDLVEISELISNLAEIDTNNLRTKLLTLNAEYWFFLGELSYYYKEWQQALLSYNSGLSYFEENVDAYRKIYSIYLNLDNQPRAIATLERLLELSPDDIETLYRLGKHWELLRDKEKAVFYYERLLDETDYYPEAVYYLAIHYHDTGDYPRASEYAKRAAALPTIPIDIAKPLISMLLELNHPNETKPLLQMLLEKEPRNADLYRSLGDISYQKQDFVHALIFYQQAVKIRPNDHYTRFHLANSLFKTGSYTDAVVHYQKALVLNKDESVYHYNLANALFNSARYQDAVDNYLIAIRLGFDSPEIYFNLGNVYYQLEDYAQSVIFYLQAVELKPDYLAALFNIAHTFELLREEDTALGYYMQVIKLDPNYYQAYYNIANYHKNLGELEKAIEFYQKSITINPEDDYSYSNMGDCYRMLGLYEEAEAAYIRAIELDPENPVPYNNLSLTYYLQEEYLKSLQYLRKAAKLGHYNARNIMQNMTLE